MTRMTRNSLLLLALFLLFAAPVFAQQQPPQLPVGVPPMPPARLSMDRGRDQNRDQNREMGREMEIHGAMGGSMGIVPPGSWWKNPTVIASLTLTADQQKKMDDIFRQNRIALIDTKASLEKEQINLEPLLNANPVDSTKALAEISKIADLRAGLEKANAKMLLGLRALLTADQWTKLQDMQHQHREGPARERDSKTPRKTGPGNQGGPGQPPPAGPPATEQ